MSNIAMVRDVWSYNRHGYSHLYPKRFHPAVFQTVSDIVLP